MNQNNILIHIHSIIKSPIIIIWGFFCLLCPLVANGQLFENDEIIQLQFEGELDSLSKDLTGKAKYFDFELVEKNAQGESMTMPVRLKTRGNTRRDPKYCTRPPILINFKKNQIPGSSYFAGQDKLKLVTPCRQDQYVIREYIAYKFYQLVTPLSYQVRLASVRFIEKNTQEVAGPFLCFILEDEDKFGDRMQSKIIKRDLIRPNHIEKENFLTLAFFEYFIGNTDWSVQYRQNIKLYQHPDWIRPIAIPYDFDHAGLVSAPYARPAPELQMSSVRERRYRGYCVEDPEVFQPIIQKFLDLKPDFLDIISSNQYLDDKNKKSMYKFIEKFYDTLSSPKKVFRALHYPCEPNNTSNIIIQGLKGQ